jgi:hypothetical protein
MSHAKLSKLAKPIPETTKSGYAHAQPLFVVSGLWEKSFANLTK